MPMVQTKKKELTSHSTRIIMITVLMLVLSTMYDNNEKCFFLQSEYNR